MLNIISLSLDKSLLHPESIGAKKTIEYAELCDRYIVVVAADKDDRVDLSPRANVFAVAGSCRLVKWWKMYVLTKMLVRKFSCQLIMSQDPFELGLIAFLVRRKYGARWNVQEHGDFFSQSYWREESALNRFRYYLGRYLIRRADSVRVVSQRIKNFLIADFGVDKEKVVAVPVLTDSEKFKLNASVGGHVFLCIGRFVKQKNLALLIRAFALVRREITDACLVLVGQGVLENELRALVASLGQSDAVTFKPWTDDVVSEYAAADAYVLSSDYEGWGRVIVEAVASGLPVVMTDTGCAGEIIKDNESGLVVSCRDEEKLAEAMMKVVRDKDLREKFVQGAKDALGRLPDKEQTLALYKKSWDIALGAKQSDQE